MFWPVLKTTSVLNFRKFNLMENAMTGSGSYIFTL